jgi:hypothetical protein
MIGPVVTTVPDSEHSDVKTSLLDRSLHMDIWYRVALRRQGSWRLHMPLCSVLHKCTVTVILWAYEDVYLCDFRLLPRCRWDVRSSGVLRGVEWLFCTTFRRNCQYQLRCLFGLLDPWKWERYVLLKRRYRTNPQSCLIYQKRAGLIFMSDLSCLHLNVVSLCTSLAIICPRMSTVYLSGRSLQIKGSVMWGMTLCKLECADVSEEHATSIIRVGE